MSQDHLTVVARESLAPSALDAREPALLLEGSWREPSANRRSLDEAIDARHGWIDQEASRLADEPAHPGWDAPSSGPPSVAYVNELKLRYYFVKLLRVVAFFEELHPVPQRIDLVVTRQRDEDYADLFEGLCASKSMRLNVDWLGGDALQRVPSPPNPLVRRLAGQFNQWTRPRWPKDGQPRVVLCGNRRVLDAVCGELVQRDAHVAWLYDRFAVKTWLRWRQAGVAQLVCDAGHRVTEVELRRVAGVELRGTSSEPPVPGHLTDLTARGIDLSRPVHRWLSNIHHSTGPRQYHLWQRVDQHFASSRPTLLVLDEDATPMARVAIAVARRHGVPSVVVQHGVPRVQFGFAPLAADHILVWGGSSRRQLLDWGVPLERIRVTGCTAGANVEHRTSNAQRRTGGAEILLFATTLPRDTRPDAVSFHLTQQTHRQMLRIACAAVAQLPDARLTIKLHPRCRDADLFHAIAQEFASLRVRIVASGGMKWLRRADCVLNCTSSAGIEAARCGVPVIELIPDGSRDLLPAAEWGACGTARTQEELEPLLRQALSHQRRAANDLEHVFAATGQQAAQKTVDALLTLECGDLSPLSNRATGIREFERRCQKPDHRRIGNWMARRVTRPLALRVTRVVLPLGVTAHMATLAAWMVGLAAAFAFGWGTLGAWLAGAVLLQMWYLLDHVDGQLARYHRSESLDGAALDYLMHHTLNLLLPIGIGWGLAAGGQPWWTLVGLACGVGLLLIGLVNDVRYKSFIKRLKRLDGELRVLGGGGGRPTPPPPLPKRPRAVVTWMLRKACEMHVIMNGLAVLAIVQWLFADHALLLGKVYLATIAFVSLLVAAATIHRSLRTEAAEDEFAQWFRVPQGDELVFQDGWWRVERSDTDHADSAASCPENSISRNVT